jgi:hypothetical protein
MSLDHLRRNPAPAVDVIRESGQAGFLQLDAGSFTGLIHWRGDRSAKRLFVHAPGRSTELTGRAPGIHIDVPGHGLSSDWIGKAPSDWEAWAAVIDAAAEHFGVAEIVHEPSPSGDPDRLFPDLRPDRFGNYLTQAWSIVRAQHLFEPWYEASAANAIRFDPGDLDPAKLAVEHRARLRARSAREYLVARRQAEQGEGDGNPRRHATARAA